jgi:hypothetical protein
VCGLIIAKGTEEIPDTIKEVVVLGCILYVEVLKGFVNNGVIDLNFRIIS